MLTAGAGFGASMQVAEYLGIQPKYTDGTQVGGSSFVIPVEHAAAEATRFAAVHGSNKATVATTQTITDFAQGQAELIPPSDMNIAVSWNPTNNNNPGSSVTVLITYNFEYLLVGFLGFDPVDLEGTSTMVIN